MKKKFCLWQVNVESSEDKGNWSQKMGLVFIKISNIPNNIFTGLIPREVIQNGSLRE